MPGTTIERIVEARLRMLEHEIPGTKTDYNIFLERRGERGEIIVSDLWDRVIYVEFVESEGSLDRPEALDQFTEVTLAGGKALVIVPDEAHSAAADLLAKDGNPSIELVSYGVVGIAVLI
ncbi:MAG: hypothetical protein SA339_02755 [Methanomassiliicoccus sp.]|nr:hypothetical protein [Methanomassiliicoccus sp.]